MDQWAATPLMLSFVFALIFPSSSPVLPSFMSCRSGTVALSKSPTSVLGARAFSEPKTKFPTGLIKIRHRLADV